MIRPLEKHQICAVVVSYNGGSDTVQNLASLVSSVGHVCVVDNGSDAVSVGLLRDFCGDCSVALIELTENKGIAHALNLGARYAIEQGYRWLLTMDQDSRMSPSIIEAYCVTAAQNPSARCMAPRVRMEGEIHGAGGVSDVVITSGNLVCLDLYLRVGGYNEALFIDCVDFDFSLKVRQLGEKIYLVENAVMDHQLGEGSAGGRLCRYYTRHPPIRRYYMYRNMIYMVKEYFFTFPLFVFKFVCGHAILLVLLLRYDEHPAVSLRYIRKGIRDFFSGKMGRYEE